MDKITKADAQKRFYKGETIYLNPSKMRIDNAWTSPCPINRTLVTEIMGRKVKELVEFDKAVNEFSYYNCNSETGKVVHYYTKSFWS